jgi:excisionase family DNA binding protein
MPKAENPRNYSALSVATVAELLGVTDRMVRNWIKDKGLPSKADPRGATLDWPSTLEWYVTYRATQKGGNGGNLPGGNGSGGAEIPPLEDYDQALARRTRAEADLKELQLARERGEVASIADVERVLATANKSIQQLILALPSSLTPQLIGLDDRQKVYTVLDRGVRSMLGNLASIDAVRQARAATGEDEPE